MFLRPKRESLANAKFTGQGTRLSEKAPWETYGDEMQSQMSPELAAAVEEYAKNRHEVEGSNQSKEELHFQRECNNELAKEYQWIKPEEYEDIEQRIGVVRTHADLITRLRKLKVNCWYTQHPQPQKATLVVTDYWGNRPPEVACWVQIGFMPELSIMRFDEHGVPLDERRRGWRTCLLQLILKGIITEQDADKMFGRPKLTDAFHRYNSTLHSFRNAGGELR